MPIEHHGIEGILLNHAVSVLSCPCLCSKSRPLKVTHLKVWNYDGSSTGQADGHNSEVLLKPRAIFNDPFRASPLRCVVLVLRFGSGLREICCPFRIFRFLQRAVS